MATQLLKPVALLTNQSMAASITSRAVEIRYQDNIGIQLHWTGAPIGSFAVQISSDHVEDIKGNLVTQGNWVPLVLNPAITASGTADDAYIDLNQMSAMYVRIVYTRTSGTGSLTAVVVGKGI